MSSRLPHSTQFPSSLISCKKCDQNNVIKSGFSHGRQRYKCKDCSLHFVRYPKRLSENIRLRAVRFCAYGIPMYSVAKMFFITVTTVARWVKWYKKYPNEKELPYDEYDQYFAELLMSCSLNKSSKQLRILDFRINQQNYQNIKPEKII